MSELPTDAGSLLALLCGYYVRERSGECGCQPMANGIACLSDSHAGVPLELGEKLLANFS